MTNQSELEQKIFSLTVETGRKFMKTRVLEDWTLSKQIMELVNAYIAANYTPNSEVMRLRLEHAAKLANLDQKIAWLEGKDEVLTKDKE